MSFRETILFCIGIGILLLSSTVTSTATTDNHHHQIEFPKTIETYETRLIDDDADELSSSMETASIIRTEPAAPNLAVRHPNIPAALSAAIDHALNNQQHQHPQQQQQQIHQPQFHVPIAEPSITSHHRPTTTTTEHEPILLSEADIDNIEDGPLFTIVHLHLHVHRPPPGASSKKVSVNHASVIVNRPIISTTTVLPIGDHTTTATVSQPLHPMTNKQQQHEDQFENVTDILSDELMNIRNDSEEFTCEPVEKLLRLAPTCDNVNNHGGVRRTCQYETDLVVGAVRLQTGDVKFDESTTNNHNSNIYVSKLLQRFAHTIGVSGQTGYNWTQWLGHESDWPVKRDTVMITLNAAPNTTVNFYQVLGICDSIQLRTEFFQHRITKDHLVRPDDVHDSTKKLFL